MTIEEIYSKLASHMIQGIMFHEQLADYYNFLGLEGYSKCHEYHFFEESISYRSLCRYYVSHHNKLINTGNIENPEVIPTSWYKYYRKDVDTNTRSSAAKNGIELWVDWKTKTKKLYESMYKELMNIDEVAAASKVKELVCDVDKELKYAECKCLKLEAIDYDMSVIIPDQSILYEKYCNKIECIWN